MDAMFSLDPNASGAAAVAAPAPVVAEPKAPKPARAVGTGGSAWLLGILTLLLAAILVADGMVAGFLPGGRDWGTSGDSSGWLVYLFAVTILVVATRAVHGGKVALRLLLVLALIFFVERAFSPFALKVIEPVQLGLHGLAAFMALALALATASAIRAGPSRRASPAT